MDLGHGESSDQEKTLKKKHDKSNAIYDLKVKKFEDPG